MEHDCLSKLSIRFNSRIDMKFGKKWPSDFREKLFNDIKMLYMYSAQGQGKTLAE